MIAVQYSILIGEKCRKFITIPQAIEMNRTM